MASDEDAPGEGAPPAEVEASPRPAPPPTRRRLSRLVLLAVGLLIAVYVGRQGPQEQHVRVVLGAAAPRVAGVDLRYVGDDGDVAREAHFVYPDGGAPRVVAHEPKLPNGAYRLEIDVDARDGRRAVQRQVTLGGGSTQVDVSSVLGSDQPPSLENKKP